MSLEFSGVVLKLKYSSGNTMQRWREGEAGALSLSCTVAEGIGQSVDWVLDITTTAISQSFAGCL